MPYEIAFIEVNAAKIYLGVRRKLPLQICRVTLNQIFVKASDSQPERTASADCYGSIRSVRPSYEGLRI